MRRSAQSSREILTYALLAITAVCVWSRPAQAQGPVVARASSVTGPTVLSNPGGSSLGLTPGYILNPGDRIDTRGGGRVVIELNDGSMVVVQPGSLIVLKDFQQASTLRELFEITVGMVRVKINHFAGKPNPYRMNSPTASIAVRGTEFSIEVTAQGDTQVVVYEGAVEVTDLNDPDRRTLVEAGRGVLVRAGQDFHMFAAPLNRIGDAGGPGGDRDHQPLMANGKPSAPPPGPSPQSGSAPPPAPQQPSSGGHAEAHNDRNEAAPHNSTSAYDRYIAALADVAQAPFLYRYNAFAEPHLDSVENPAYATQFRTGEGRLFFLPSYSGARGPDSPINGAGASVPGDYSLSPQLSIFTPLGDTKFTIGGSLALSRVGNAGLAGSPEFDPSSMAQNSPGYGAHANMAAPPPAEGASTTATGNFYSGSLALARRFGASSFGAEAEILRGNGSLVSAFSDNDPGHSSLECLDSRSSITQTRLTVGYSLDVGRTAKLGLFYRYGFIDASDADVAHTFNSLATPFNATHTFGHSSEVGMRWRSALTSRLFYGFSGSWLGVSLRDGLTRTSAVDSLQRDRAQRISAGAGIGYALTRKALLSFDLGGGATRSEAARTEDTTGALLQNGTANSRFLSMHVSLQSDLTRRLFVSASFMNVWRGRDWTVALFPDRYGNRILVENTFFPLTSAAYQLASHVSDFGVGWRFSRDVFAQYLFSTDYGFSSPSHTLMLRYTFHWKRE